MKSLLVKFDFQTETTLPTKSPQKYISYETTGPILNARQVLTFHGNTETNNDRSAARRITTPEQNI